MQTRVVRRFRHRGFWVWAAFAAALTLAAACQDTTAVRVFPWSDEDSVKDSTKTGMLTLPVQEPSVWV